jgi:hypothetical protein
MARRRSPLRPVLLLSFVLATSLPVLASQAPAVGLPGGGPLDDLARRGRDTVERTREKVNDTLQDLNGLRDRADQTVWDVVGSVGSEVGGATGVDRSPGGRSTNEEQDGKAGEQAGGSPARGAKSDGDIDELTRAGNQIREGGTGGQVGVGISVPAPAPGGSNAQLGFTGMNLLIALLFSLTFAVSGAILLLADARRVALVRPTGIGVSIVQGGAAGPG